MTFTPNWKVDAGVHLCVQTKGSKKRLKIIRLRNVSLQLAADEDLINKGSLGCNTVLGKYCLSISYGLSKIKESFCCISP